MTQLTMRSAALLVVGALWLGCPPSSNPADSGVDAGVDAGPSPEDRTFSVGIGENFSGPPQSATPLQLRFERGEPSSDTIVARRVTTPPTLDGDGAEWNAIVGSTISLVGPAASIGLSKEGWDAIYLDAGNDSPPKADQGVYSAEVKAAFDDQNIYFLVSWPDATENRRQQEWTFDGTAWKRSTQSEDKVSLSFNVRDSFPPFETVGCAAACHVKERLDDVTDAGLEYRFKMHTNDAGEIADLWAWRATRSNPVGHADDLHWDEVSRKNDGTGDVATRNSRTFDGGSEPLYMPEGGLGVSADYIFLGDAGTPRAVPFDGTGAVVGMKLPGFVHRRTSPVSEDIFAVGKWAAGRWTVEFKRSLTNNDPKDAQFPLK